MEALLENCTVLL